MTNIDMLLADLRQNFILYYIDCMRHISRAQIVWYLPLIWWHSRLAVVDDSLKLLIWCRVILCKI